MSDASEDERRQEVLEALEELVGRELADALVPGLEQVLDARTPKGFHDAERGVHEVAAQLADAVVALGLKALAADPEFEAEERARTHRVAREKGVQMKSCGRKETIVRLLGGTEVRVRALKMARATPTDRRKRKKHGRRGAVGSGVYPTLAALGITEWATPALRERVARSMAAANSVDAARADLREIGLDVPHKRFLRLSYSFAEQARLARDERMAAAPDGLVGEYAGKRVVIGTDGGRLRVRESPTHGRRNAKGHRKYLAPWREPKLLTIYVVDENGDRDRTHDVVIDATMGDCNDVVALLIGHLRLRGAQHCASLTLVGDGAHWIWNRAEAIRAAVGVSPEKFREVVDFYHAVEKLTDVANTQPQWSRKARRAFLTRNRRRIRNAERQPLYAELTGLMTDAAPDVAKVVEEVLGYYDNNESRMDYPELRRAGLPLGSGAVESAVRRVINQRLKGNSIYWTEDHAEDVLHLRAHLKAGRWGELVDAHLSRPVWTPIPIGQAA